MRTGALLGCLSVVLSLTCTTASAKRPDRPGRFEVGFTSFVERDASRNNRPTALSVFYPVDRRAIDDSSRRASYSRNPVNNPEQILDSTLFEELGIDAAYQTPVPSDHAPFPLVLFSPGLGTPWDNYVYIGTRVASHGYVVAIMSHFADTTYPEEPRVHLRVTMKQRSLDTSFALNQLLAHNDAPGDLLYRTMDPGIIIAAGHSVGGYTAISIAGGQGNVCNPVPMNPPPPGSCVGIAPDPRFIAIATLDASNFLTTFEDMQNVHVPSLGLGRDPATLLAENSQYGAAHQARQHAAFSGAPGYRVDVINSRHAPSFTNICEETLVRLAAGQITQAAADSTLASVQCYDPRVIAPIEAHRLVTEYMIEFLDQIADVRDDDAGENASHHLLDPQWSEHHEPNVAVFLTEEGGLETGLRNLAQSATFQWFWNPPDTKRLK